MRRLIPIKNGDEKLNLNRKNRCIHHIIYDMLRALTRKPLRKTNLCLTANLPLDRCSPILSLLESYGLIYKTEAKGENLFFITEAGYIYVGLYQELLKLIPIVNNKKPVI